MYQAYQELKSLSEDHSFSEQDEFPLLFGKPENDSM